MTSATMTPTTDGSELPVLRRYAELRDRGREAAEAGRTLEALELLEEALDLARRAGDPELVDRATCNRAAVLIEIGRHRETFAPLRAILIRQSGAETSLLASYNIAQAHIRDHDSKKGLFYARIARDRAEAANNREWTLRARILIANCLMDESHYSDAASEYTEVLEAMPEEPSVVRATALTNLGACWVLVGAVRRGMALSLRSLRELRVLGVQTYEFWPRLDLCNGYMELGRYRRARLHGRLALELAEKAGDPNRTKLALFLMGEVERAAGEVAAANGFVTELQERFYPESPHLVSLMTEVEMRQAVNLRA